MINSLRVRLALGAGLTAVVAVIASLLTIYGAQVTQSRLGTALEAQARLEQYSALSVELSRFGLVATAAAQPDADSSLWQGRLDAQIGLVQAAFSRIEAGLERDVAQAERLGLNEQSRRASRGIVIARMRAIFGPVADAFSTDSNNRDPARLQAELNVFSSRFAPLLGELISEDNRVRLNAFEEVEQLRGRLVGWAVGVAAAALAIFALFYIKGVQPLFARLDLLRRASRQIAEEDFKISLPEGRPDEVDQLFDETRRMADALAQRKATVESDWARLNDIIKERTAELVAANSRLAQVDEDRQSFFAGFSHELRTPLTVILIEAELGIKRGQAVEGFETIHARAEKLNRKIDDLLRLARSENGQITITPSRFNLAEAAQEAVSDIRRMAERAEMTVEVMADNDVPVFADPNWTRQVIEGLIENALRHAKLGGKIAVRVQADGDVARFMVIDNGPGLGDVHPSEVFRRFEQGRDATRHGGFGLGLALAKWVVEEQGGGISVLSPVPVPFALGDNPGMLADVRIPMWKEETDD